MKGIINWFDKFEDKIRARLSKHPILYALIGGTSIVLFWRGVWHLADRISFTSGPNGELFSLGLSVVVMLATGTFVSFFITNRVLLSGLLHEKKLAEKTHDNSIKLERTELMILKDLEQKVDLLQQEVLSLRSIHGTSTKKKQRKTTV